MRKFHGRCSIVTIAIMVLVLTALSVRVFAAEQQQEKDEKEEITVGYTPYDPMIKEDKDGNLYGYGVTYLNELARRAGWKYKFVEVNESERIEKLLNGDIDLLCGIHKDCAQKDQLLFCKETTALEYGMLATLKNNTDIFFDDFQHINGKKIGINTSSDLENALVRYAKENGISYEPVYFDDYESLQEALNNKTIDIMLVSSLRDIDNIKYVGKTYSIPESFAVSGNNPQLMDKLNKTDLELKREQPFYIAALHEVFFGAPYQKLTGITREEYEYVSSEPTIKVAYNSDSYPIEYTDEKTNKYAGVYAETMQLISQESGLKFEYIPIKDFSKAWEMVRDGEADIIAGSYMDRELAEKYHMLYSQSYLSEEYTIVGRKGEEIPENAVIALPKCFVEIQSYFQSEEPKWEIKEYKDITTCLEAVNEGEADLTAVNSVFLQTVYNLSNYEQLRIVPNMTRTIPIYIGIGENTQNASVLKSILDKTINKIPEEKFQKCVTENAINISYKPTIWEVVRQFIPHILLAISAVIVAVAYIISKREKHYKHLALTDSVTGLWNEVKFNKEAQELLEKNQEQAYIVITIDINKFKFINNDFGVRIGDNILKTLGKRIQEIFGGVGIYAREAADVFMIMMAEKDYREEMLRPLGKEISFENAGKRQSYRITIKAGICVIEAGGERKDISRYVDQASMARKNIKESASENIAYYDEKIKKRIAQEIAIENKMEDALLKGEFQVYLQPKYYLPTGEIVGAEALVRWVEPSGKIIPPDNFIPLFERNGFIIQVDFYVYEQVMKRMQKWKQEGRRPICVSVNVSRVHVRTYDFFQRLNELIEKYQIPKEYFELELTETIMGSAQGMTKDFIQECKKQGYKVSIDDFGSGYSSLNLLKDLPVDILKIDKGFLDETAESERSSIIVEQVVEMAKKMKIGTLCEGVETLKQAEFLKGIGCDMAQGYLFSKPIPMEEFEKMI